MPQIGATPISLRGPGPWGGFTTLSRVAPFRFTELLNCYVSADGNEIRTFPGFVPVLDPASYIRNPGFDVLETGYVKTHPAARRAVVTAIGATEYSSVGVSTETLNIWSRPTTIHCVEQMNGRWVFVGEDDFEREPISDAGLTSYVRVISYDDNAGTSIDLTLNVAPKVTASTFNSVQVGDRITLANLTGTLAGILNDRGHVVTNIAGAVVRISTSPGGAISAVVSQSGFIDRVTSTTGASTVISDDVESLCVWTSLDRGDPADTTPPTLVYAAHVANRQRDFGDLVGQIKQGNANAATISGGRSRRRQLSLPYRVVPHVAGNRIVLAAPGYSCVFQVPGVISPNFDNATEADGINSFGNDIFDRPRCLGVPKAVLWEDPDKAVATTVHIAQAFVDPLSWGGTITPTRAGVYKFAAAYKDDATGEVGLRSEIMTVTTDTSSTTRENIRLFIYFPGYLMHESLALSINIYRSKLGGETLYFDRTIRATPLLSAGPGALLRSWKYGIAPESATTEYFHHVVYEAIYSSDEELATHTDLVPQTIEQMPMGCKAARTIRGWTLFGGSLGDAGKNGELRKGTLSLVYDKNGNGNNGYNYFKDRLSSVFTNDWALPIPASFEGVETGWGCAARSIPPAYMGQLIASKTLFPYSTSIVRLNKLENSFIGSLGSFPDTYSGRHQDIQYSMQGTPIRELEDLYNSGNWLQTTYLILPRGKINISEPDNPGIVPSTSVTVLANEFDHDIEAIGDAGGQAVICTRARTYTLAFAGTPVGVSPDVVNDRFGCIAPNSMVSFEGGCAWISERGPVAMLGGSVQWIGQDLERLFIGRASRYVRDNAGMMRHSWSCHDAERCLLYFGVLTEGSTATVSYRGVSYGLGAAMVHEDKDKILSRFPCDEVLVYSYKVGAWSKWVPPSSLSVQWMTRGIDVNGINRVFFLGGDKRLYVLDDIFSQGVDDATEAVSTQSGTLSTLNVASVGVTSWVGLTVLVYSNAAPMVMRGSSTITASDGATITLASPITLSVGDIILVGARSMSFTTTFFNTKSEATARLGSVGMRYGFWSQIETGMGGSVRGAFANCQVKTNQIEDDVPVTKSVTLTNSTDSAASPSYDWLGRDEFDGPIYDRAFRLGSSSGGNHQVSMSIIGGPQVRLSDLSVEVQ